MNKARSNLYDVEWQSLRVSLLNKFVTVEGMKENLRKLREYLLDTASDDDQEFFIRLYREINLLNGTRMGFSGMGLYNTEQDKMLVLARDSLQHDYEMMKRDGFTFKEIDWKKVETDLKELNKSDHPQFVKIRNNLISRKNSTLKRSGTLENRQELVKFLKLMNI